MLWTAHLPLSNYHLANQVYNNKLKYIGPFFFLDVSDRREIKVCQFSIPLDIILKVVANLSRRGRSQRNLWIISWCLAHTQLLAPALFRAAMATVVPEMITNSREERDRDFALFTEGGGWSRE